MTPLVVHKSWGHELVFASGNGYTGKLLHFNPSKHGSMHYHIKKHESWYVASGGGVVSYFNHTTGEQYTRELCVGDVFVIPPGHAHMFHAGPLGCVIFEASTPDDPTDTYRTVPSGK